MSTPSIIYSYPDIASEWDYEKNVDVDINLIYKTSRHLAHWKCKNGHTYQTSVFSRVRSNGCKECNKSIHSENKVKSNALKGISFSEANPQIISEWDIEKNKYAPNEVSSKSHLIVWFKCNKGHEWTSTPKRRTRGDGCPICAKDKLPQSIRLGKLKKAGISFALKYPDLLNEWDYEQNIISPEDLTPQSNYKAYWCCRFNHYWQATIYNRTQNKSGCPYCKSSTSKLEVFVLCEFKRLFDNVLWRGKISGYECDVIIEDIKIGIEIDGAYWHDDKLERDILKNKIFNENGYKLLRLRDYRLPMIEGNVILFDNKTKEVELVSNLLILIKKIIPKVEISDYIANKKQIGLLEYNKILSLLPAPTETETLAFKNPILSLEWDFEKNFPLTPEMFSPNSEKKVFWMCNNGHPSWEASIKNRNLRKSGCPKCYKENAGTILRSSLLRKSNTSLGKESPIFLREWDYERNAIDPFEVSSKSKLKVHWKCNFGHNFEMSIELRNRGSNCPKCHQNNRGEILQRALLKKSGTSFSNMHPDLLDEWDYDMNLKTPDEYSPKSASIVNWKCKNGHKWQAAIQNRSNGIGKCVECNSITFLRPDLLTFWDYNNNLGIEPGKTLIGSNKKVWWKCIEHHSFQRPVYEMNKNHKCPICNRLINKI